MCRFPCQRPPRRRGAKKEAVEGETAEPTAEGETPAVKATRPPRKAKTARIDEETGEPVVRAPRAPRAPREAPTGEPSKTLLFVANLPFTLDDEGLEKVFTDAGVKVATARIVKRKFGIKRSKGFGFVDTVSETEQQKGLAADGTEVEGRAIAVKVALNSQQEPEGEGKEAVTEEQKEATA
jgi:RNA recognition motif-containing protein